MGTGFSKKKKQARMMQQQIAQMQSSMETAEASGSAGNGLVTITLSGQGEIKSIKIKPECVDAEDIEGLETLVKAAHNDALKKMQDQQSKSMPGGLGAFGF